MTTEPHTVDGTAVEVLDEHHTPDTPPVAAVVRRERRSEVIRPLAADALVESFRSYQELLPRLLTDDDYQAADGKRFVKKSGWRKIATAFDLDVQLIRSTIDRDADGKPLRAEVWARAIAPSGRSMDGDGYCSADESRFSSARGRQKLENDLRATATTRAMNRAISGLVGMGEVSAEEVDAGEQHGRAWATPANDQLKRDMVAVLADVIGDRATAVQYAKVLADQVGAVPGVVAAWVAALPAWLTTAEARAATTAPEATADPAPQAAPKGASVRTGADAPNGSDDDEHAAWARAADPDALARVAGAGSDADPARVAAAQAEVERRMTAARATGGTA